MKVSLFDYKLPQKLIAQTPIEPRDASRLMVLSRSKKTIEHKKFTDLPDFLKKDDLLIINDTKVLPARLKGYKKDTGGKIEILLLRQIAEDTWEALAKPAKRLPEGTNFDIAPNSPPPIGGEGRGEGETLRGKIIQSFNGGRKIIEFSNPKNINEAIHKLGEMPLPPYIKTPLKTQERYQTIYANKESSAAAPTAGLHFTENLIKKIKAKGVEFATVNLSVGLDTFRPITVEDIEENVMHSEEYEVSAKTVEKIIEARKQKRRIIAVGTTSTRVLETIAPIINNGEIKAIKGKTDIFIYPGFKFKLTDALITNFHLPRSTLLMMVSAFGGREFILRAYKEAIEKEYRFFSFGDSMIAFNLHSGKLET